MKGGAEEAGDGFGRIHVTESNFIYFGAGVARDTGAGRRHRAQRAHDADLFEEGRVLEFSLRHVAPEQYGVAGAGVPTGNLFESYTSWGFAYKADLNERLSYAIILDDPWGVDTAYPGGAPYAGVVATLDSRELTAILAYDVDERIKVYGGLRIQQIEAQASIPFVGGYTVSTDKQTDLGYMFGAAYQIPDIALRVALTYYSAIEHEMNTLEFGALNSVTGIETPQAVNLEFQSGIAEDTLLFGSIRWVDWSEFAIRPPNYPPVTLVDYQEDWITYTLGIGRRLNENWSVAAQVSHEPAAGYVPLTTLGPVDGRTSIGLGATYTMDNIKVTGGITYAELGSTQNVLGTTFDGGKALGFGLRVGYSF